MSSGLVVILVVVGLMAFAGGAWPIGLVCFAIIALSGDEV